MIPMNNVRTLISKIKTSESSYPVVVFNETGRIYTFINPYSYHLVRKKVELFGQMDGLFVDGMLMCLLCNILYGLKIHRRSFDNTTVAKDLFSYLSHSRKSVYFVGASENEIVRSITNYRKAYPQMNIIGYRNGFFKTIEERKDTIEQIKRLSPDFLVVGMGAILQEEFLLEVKGEGFCGIGFSCGGYIRQSAEGIEYFPKWIDKFNLRAFYRLYKEKGMFRRLYNVLLEFPVLFIYDFLRLKK